MLDAQDIEGIVREAGALAVSFFGRVRAETKGDGSIVTEADRAVQRLIVERLRAIAPDPRELFVLGEEAVGDPNGGVSSIEAATVAAIDPIDGTTAFSRGMPTWGVSLGLLESGRPVAGAFFLPLIGPDGWLFLVDRDGPATLSGEPLRVPPFRGWDHNSQVTIPSGFPRRARLAHFTGKCRSLGSTAHHIALAASGAVDGTVVGRARIWDIAAVAAVLERAGGVLEGVDGAPPDWAGMLDGRRSERSLLAGSREAVDALRAALRWREVEG